MKHFRSKLLAAAAALLLSSPAFCYTVVVDGIGFGSTPAPVLTSCGTSPTIVGTDLAGTVTTGTGTPTGCVITFNTAKSATPFCSVTPGVIAPVLAAASYTVSTSAITITQTATNSVVYKYICVGQ
jgi:hypothetical protein